MSQIICHHNSSERRYLPDIIDSNTNNLGSLFLMLALFNFSEILDFSLCYSDSIRGLK